MKNKANKLHYYNVDTQKDSKTTWFYLRANSKIQVEDYLKQMGIVFYNIFGPIKDPYAGNNYVDITQNTENQKTING